MKASDSKTVSPFERPSNFERASAHLFKGAFDNLQGDALGFAARSLQEFRLPFPVPFLPLPVSFSGHLEQGERPEPPSIKRVGKRVCISASLLGALLLVGDRSCNIHLTKMKQVSQPGKQGNSCCADDVNIRVVAESNHEAT
jgi:hypothetical protein